MTDQVEVARRFTLVAVSVQSTVMTRHILPASVKVVRHQVDEVQVAGMMKRLIDEISVHRFFL